MTQLLLFDSAGRAAYTSGRREGQVERHGSLTVTEPEQRGVTAPPAIPSAAACAPSSAMHPADLAAHRAARARQDRRRLAEAVRQVAVNATPDELLELEALVFAVQSEAISVDQALNTVAAGRRQQQAAA